MLIKVVGYPIIRASAMIDYTNTPVAQITDIKVRADVGGDLNNTFFHMWSANNGTSHTFWFNVDAGGTVPNLAFTTPQAVAISANDSAEVIEGVLVGVIDGLSDFTAVAKSGEVGVVTVTNAANGGSDAPRDAWALNETDSAILATGFTFDVTTKGIAFTPPTNAKLIRITGKMHSTKAEHRTKVRGGQGGPTTYVESPFNYSDVEVIVQEQQIVYVLER